LRYRVDSVTDLERIDVAAPRPIEVCRQYVGRIDGGWLMLMALVIVATGLTAGLAASRFGRTPMEANLLVAVGGVLGVMVHLMWRAYRRRLTCRLLRDGVLLDVTREQRAWRVVGRAGPDRIVRFVGELDETRFDMLARFSPLCAIEVGDRCRILYLAGCSRCAAFDRHGRLHAGLVLLPMARS
jgi:hypothetical protein